jgi:hypothetical protein
VISKANEGGMNMAQPGTSYEPLAAQDPVVRAFEDGRRAGLATAALAVSVIAFLSLLGAEKAMLAIALGLFARRGARPGSAGRTLATIAIALGTVFLVTVAIVLIVFWNELVGLVNHLMQLS